MIVGPPAADTVTAAFTVFTRTISTAVGKCAPRGRETDDRTGRGAADKVFLRQGQPSLARSLAICCRTSVNAKDRPIRATFF